MPPRAARAAALRNARPAPELAESVIAALLPGDDDRYDDRHHDDG